jgi:hypothetical protein
MKQELKDGLLYGVLTAGAAYATVMIMGFNHGSLAVLLYLYVVSSALINLKAEILTPFKPLLKKIVVVAEGEEVKMKKLLTGETYRVRGEVEKL